MIKFRKKKLLNLKKKYYLEDKIGKIITY